MATEKPSRIAVRSATERLSYAELDTRAEALRDRLVSVGVLQGTLVGIFLDSNCSRPHSGRSWNWAGVGVAEKV